MNRASSAEEALFAAALAQPPAERSAFLRMACGADAALLGRLVALVAVHQETNSILAGAPVQLPPVHEEKAGDLIGHYKLLQKLGEGGCGVVWMAEQSEPVRRRVALKVIKLGMDTKAVVARFEAERQALAMMDHPNIAKVHDAGSTESGRPFFVMELVRGIPITQFCDDNCLPTRERLELFIEVCHAIQHAHQKGIIHRDVKPSNVLVTWHDDIAAPMVIDFGIAKATQGRLTDQTLFTAFEQFLGTPVYMSPEQAEFNALDVDTRSDIYSLGVLLYELLTGRPPFDPNTLRDAGLEQIRQIIREAEPPRPSTRVNTLDDSERTTVAKLRGTAPAQLSTLLRGDLDWIVLKAIEKNRARRYQTANAFAADIQRSLAHEVVVARPPSAVYRIRKFIARHTVGFAAAATAAVLLMVGLALLAISLVREKAARELAVEAQRLAIKQAAQADLVLGSQFLDQGKLSEGLAYLVRAGRKDPTNPVIAPRLLTTLAAHNFSLPVNAPVRLTSPAAWTSYSSDGKRVFVQSDDNSLTIVDADRWRIERTLYTDGTIRRGGVRLAARNPAIFAIALSDDSIRICDSTTGKLQVELKPGERLAGPFPTFELSPDGRWLAARSTTSFWIWGTATGALMHTRPVPSFTKYPYIAFNHESTRLATETTPVMYVISVPDGAPIWEQPFTRFSDGSGVYAYFANFSADGNRLLARYHNGFVMVNAVTGERFSDRIAARTSTAVVARYTSTAFLNRDGSRLVYISTDQTVVVRDTTTGKPVFPPLSHGSEIVTAQFDQSEQRLLTSSIDGVIRLWDMETGTLLAQPTFKQNRYAPATLSPDGRAIAVFSGSKQGYKLSPGNGAAAPLVLPSDGKTRFVNLFETTPTRMALIGSKGIRVIDVASGQDSAESYAFPFKALNARIRSEYGDTVDTGHNLVILSGGRQWRTLKLGERGIVNDVALDAPPHVENINFNSRGEVAVGYAAAGTTGRKTIWIWDLTTGKQLGTIHSAKSFTGGPRTPISPDGKLVAFFTPEDLVLHVCDTATGTERFFVELTDNVPLSIAGFRFSADSKYLLTGDDWGGVHIWNASNGRLVQSRETHRAVLKGFEFSVDGKYYASLCTDGSIQVWDSATHTEVGSLLIQSAAPTGGVFSPSGLRFATAGGGQSRVWDIGTGYALNPIMDHGGEQVTNVAYGPDGRFLQTVSRSGTVRIWAAPPESGDVPTPDWILDLATICAGQRITDDGKMVSAEFDYGRIDEIRRIVSVLPANDRYAEWGRWFLSTRGSRPIAPVFTITPAEAKQRQSEFAEAGIRFAAQTRQINALNERAFALFRDEKWGEAEIAYRDVIEQIYRRDGRDGRTVASVLSYLARALVQQGKFDEAERVGREALRIAEPLTLLPYIQRSLGDALLGQRRLAEAEPHLLSAYGGVEGVATPGAREFERETAAALAGLYASTNQTAKAAEWRKLAAATRRPAKDFSSTVNEPGTHNPGRPKAP